LLTATALASPATQERVRSRFTAHGIAAGRIEIGNLAGVESGLAALSHADIALDTFPYNGGTTTANALWMGLPVITLSGQSPISRQGVSFLSNLRLTELIARSREQYVSLAVDLARDLDRLAALRAGMRERMLASPIMDGPGFVLGLEGIYRAMWSAFCAAHPSSC
jgi:predicted O-linked N-acetylglucosamine transferase (SPINDLY family)